MNPKFLHTALALCLLPLAPAPAQDKAAPVAAPAASAKNLSPAEAEKLLKENATAVAAKTAAVITILDVRTSAEHSAEQIKGSTNVDFRGKDFAEQISKLDKTKPYLLHCKSGGRSSASLDLMKKLGFTQLFHLDGGLEAWKKASLPTVSKP